MLDDRDIGRLLDSDPSVHHNRPKIAGTGVTVKRIAGWYKLGNSPEEIVRKIPHLTLSQVFAALTYYQAYRDEIEQDLADEISTYERLAADHAAQQTPRAS